MFIDMTETTALPSILSYRPDELKTKLIELGFKPFASDQILDWIYKKFVLDVDKMSNVSKAHRDLLKKEFKWNWYSSVQTFPSSDKLAIKYVFRLDDHNSIESVVLKEKKYVTLCVSSQAGCPVDCKFCLTGVVGFKRNLDASEIVGQILAANQDGHGISHLVFMGMGEPLLNYENVFKAIDILNHEKGFMISKRKMTLSTSGYLHGIKRLIEDNRPINLAFSVGNANPLKRVNLMPIEKRNPIMEVAKLLKQYQDSHNRKLTLEYTLLEGQNDSPQDIKELCALATYLDAKVNLINLNPHPKIPFKPVSSQHLLTVKHWIHKAGVPVTIRFRKGQDISAACGQLGESYL